MWRSRTIWTPPKEPRPIEAMMELIRHIAHEHPVVLVTRVEEMGGRAADGMELAEFLRDASDGDVRDFAEQVASVTPEMN